MGARPDQGHVALQHVEELGQLVDAGPAQQGADAGHAGIATGGLVHHRPVVQHAHGAELVDLERMPVLAGAGLAEEHGALAVEAYRRATRTRRGATRNRARAPGSGPGLAQRRQAQAGQAGTDGSARSRCADGKALPSRSGVHRDSALRISRHRFPSARALKRNETRPSDSGDRYDFRTDQSHELNQICVNHI